ncbi:MAG: glycosyltransferase involved in cell wall biosynthesis [Gammaproteobacteria bacterium]|jgi:glycosyltransferase involved in cell wall biosynthesis
MKANNLFRRRLFEDIKVSIVMPAFNRADRIGNAINSVLAQSHKNFELLIIDDGSTDNTKEVLERFSNDDRVRVFWNDHLGVSAARNTGLHNATGQYIFYLDSDNTWTVDFLAVMVVALKTSGKACMYGASKLQNASDEVIGYRGESTCAWPGRCDNGTNTSLVRRFCSRT